MKVRQSQAYYGVLNSSKKRTKLTILSREDAQDSEFCSIFERIEETVNCFRDCLSAGAEYAGFIVHFTGKHMIQANLNQKFHPDSILTGGLTYE